MCVRQGEKEDTSARDLTLADFTFCQEKKVSEGERAWKRHGLSKTHQPSAVSAKNTPSNTSILCIDYFCTGLTQHHHHQCTIMVKSVYADRGLQSNLLALQRGKSKLFMCATGSLNQTSQCEFMAWKHWEIHARLDPYIEIDAGGEYKGGSRRQWDTGVLNVYRVLRSPQPWKWLSDEKYSAFINLEEIRSYVKLRCRKQIE